MAVNAWTTGGVDTNWSTAGNWSLGHKPAAGEDVTMGDVSDQDCVINEATANLKSLDMTGYTGTMSGGNGINIRGATGTTQNCIFAGTLTWTGILTFIPQASTAHINFTSGGLLFNRIILANSASTVTLQDNLSFTAAKTDYIQIHSGGAYLDLNGKTISGNSGVNRLLITSNTLGTVGTAIQNALATSFFNCDFRDITFTTAGALDLSNGQTKAIGDCGGNTASGGALTFTTADDWYWNGSGTQVFSDYTYWYTATNGGGSQMGATRCPLPQDTCYFDADSIDGATTIDQDMPRMCKTLDFTGVDAMAFHMDNLAQTLYGGLTFVSNVTVVNAGSKSVTFESMDRSGSYDLNMGGKSFFSGGSTGVNINAVGGTIRLTGAFSETAGHTLTLNNGTFDANDNNVSVGFWNSNNSNARTILMGNGSWTIIGTSAGIPTTWNMGTTLPPTGLTNPTTMGEGSSLTIGYNGANNQTFAGGSCTYNNLSITGGSTQVVTITGSNTFNVFTINAPKTVKFTAGTTTTVSSFVAEGTLANPIVIDNTTATGSLAATLSDTSGTNTVKYCTIGTTYNVNASGGATWNALISDGNTVTNGTGWTTTSGGGGYMTCNKMWGT